MHILFLVSSMRDGGAERVAATVCNAWAERGDRVTLVATYSGRGGCHYNLHGSIEFRYLADMVPWARHQMLGYLPRLHALRRIVRESSPDVVISFLVNVNIAAALGTIGLDAPLIVCERNDPMALTSGRAPVLRILRRWVYPLADLVTVQTESARRRLLECAPGLRTVEVVANPIPESLVLLGRRAADHGSRRIVAMGRLSPQKQFDHLIDAFAALAPRFPMHELWIWGEGPLRQQLEQQVRIAGLSGRVRLPGRTQDPWTEMLGAEVFVLTSAYEGFPNVLLEAMALGLPAVAYDCPSGPREISEDGRVARLVPLNDREGLKNALGDLLDDSAARSALAELGARSVISRFQLPAILARWDMLISAARRARNGKPLWAA